MPTVLDLATHELSCPDQSVQIIQTYSQPSRCLNCGNLGVFIRHKSPLTLDDPNAYTRLMQRDTYDAVTVPILVPASTAEKEGEAWLDEPVKVRRFLTEDIEHNSNRGKKTWGEIDTWRQKEMLNLVELVRAIRAKDTIAMEKATITLKSTRGPIERAVSNALMKEPGYIESILAKELSSRLEHVRFVIWQWQGETGPALLCPDVATALLIRVVMSAVGAQAGLRLCPKCGQAFLQKRADQDYCSVKCREAHRVERWRAQKSGTSKVKLTGKERAPLVETKGRKPRRRTKQ